MIIDQYGWYNNSEDKSVGGITEYLCYQMVERERARERERERGREIEDTHLELSMG